MNFNNRVIKVKARIWDRDSYGLYDYEARNYYENNINLNTNGDLIRNKRTNEIFFMQDRLKQYEYDYNDYEILLSIQAKNGQISLSSTGNSKIDEYDNLWEVIQRTTEANRQIGKYALNKGDMLKFGRIIFKVKQIKLDDKYTQIYDQALYRNSIYESIKEHMAKSVQNDYPTCPTFTVPSIIKEDELIDTEKSNFQSNSSICRICLSEYTDNNDPLIAPCKCSGSLKFVHLQCLQEWVKSRLNLQEINNIVTMITWKNLNCELCKTTLPFSITHNNQEFCIVTFNNHYTKYIVLEVFSKDKKPTGIYILDMTNSQRFVLGRGHNCDIKISDISVSRIHAVLTQDKGKIYLEDNESKFGTLMLRKNNINLQDNKELLIQNGRVLLKFTIKRPWLSMIPCIGNLFRMNYHIANTNNNHNNQAIMNRKKLINKHDNHDKTNNINPTIQTLNANPENESFIINNTYLNSQQKQEDDKNMDEINLNSDISREQDILTNVERRIPGTYHLENDQ